jgi:hypothetical protein
VIDGERSGWPSTTRTVKNIKDVRETVADDRRLTVRDITDKVQIDRETAWKILTEDLCLGNMCAKMVPKQQTDEQKKKKARHLPRPFGETR